MSRCEECGHEIPPEDPTPAQVDAFLDDDTNKGCGACSFLWLRLVAHVIAREGEHIAILRLDD